MKTLLVYTLPAGKGRTTIENSLQALQKYLPGSVFPINSKLKIPATIHACTFDLIFYHYSFLSNKWGGRDKFHERTGPFSCIRGRARFAVAMPQDEYFHSDLICGFIRDFKVDILYTCCREEDWETVYPESSTGTVLLRRVLTGYFDPDMVTQSAKFIKPHRERPLDLGYRARKYPFWLGRHALKKWQVTDIFKTFVGSTELKIDLSNEEDDAFLGESWFRFLADCRVVLGCEGGASLHDPDGSLRAKVDSYVAQHKNADFAEVEEKFFPGMDGNISLFALSPRHFEACATRTCQVLIEGEYNNVFKPGVHYIELKKDYSNLAEVVEMLKDKVKCEEIAANAFTDICMNGKYTYENFVNSLIADLLNLDTNIVLECGMAGRAERKFLRSLHVHRLVFALRSVYMNTIWVPMVRLLKKLNLFDPFKKLVVTLK